MAVHQLLLRGMLVGLVAGLVAFGFARVIGEPSVEQAIAFESAQSHHHDHGEHVAKHDDEPELFSRNMQANTGLLVGAMIYGSAVGGLFALLFALVYGRLGALSPRACAAVLALLCFVAVFAVPYLKYPANPPAVGAGSTIGIRTGLYFSMIAISVVAMMTAFSLKRLLEDRLGAWNALLIGTLAFVLLAAAAIWTMPDIDEVPRNFPAETLWQFRMSAFGVQAILWSVIGLLFGSLTERRLSSTQR